RVLSAVETTVAGRPVRGDPKDMPETVTELMAQHTDETAPYDDNDPAFQLHVGGKLETRSTVPLLNREDLSLAYTPGVARVCSRSRHGPTWCTSSPGSPTWSPSSPTAPRC